MMSHVLIVDDDPNLCEVLKAELAGRGFHALVMESPEEALAHTERGQVDIILTDVNMHSLTGVELCSRVNSAGRDIPVVVMTAFGSIDSAMSAIKAGAYDYVTKPLQIDDLVLTLERGIRERALREEARRLRLEVHCSKHFENMAGGSPAMKKTFKLIDRVAKSDVTVLVTGESGSGKELAAKAIHARSSRSKKPFIALNCAAMPENLLESELFGHTKGAFTDAHQARRGLFLQASGGTLLLDEIGEMPIGVQAKLLRALQERTVRPVGADEDVPFDTRIIAATHRNLEVEVTERRFRADLFYRIHVVRVDVPPLRARGRDVLTLAKHILRSCQPNGPRVLGFRPAVVEALLSYPWPGNVRELQNCIQRAVALAEFDHIGIEDLPDGVRGFKSSGLRVNQGYNSDLMTAEELERSYISKVMQVVEGDKAKAARILGFDPRTLERKLEAARTSPGRPRSNDVSCAA